LSLAITASAGPPDDAHRQPHPAAWLAFIAARKTEDLNRIIAEEVWMVRRRGPSWRTPFAAVQSQPPAGTAITKILPPVSRFSADAAHSTKKRTVLERLSTFFERYFGLANEPSASE
jgi:type I restriction enzyme R subunit